MAETGRLLAVAFVILLASGCVSNQQNAPNATTNPAASNQTNSSVPAPAVQPAVGGGIQVTDEGSVQVASVAANGTAFPMQEYPNQFTSVGFYSDTFVKIDSSSIKFLDGNESIWLTPQIRGNRTILLNAIYSRSVSCSPDTVTILGKDYSISALRNASALDADPKWKVALYYNGSCLSRVIVYMDGYYGNLGDGDTVPLFMDDGGILFRLDRSGQGQSISVIATKPA